MEKNEEMVVNVCLYPFPVTEKPRTKAELDFLEAETLKNEMNIKISDLSYYVGQTAYPMCCATFKDGIKSRENFKSIQLFMLEFERNNKLLTFDNLYLGCYLHCLPISFVYIRNYTYKHILKYCVAFLHYVPINDLDLATNIQRRLLELFPEADQTCVDPCRLIIGSTDLSYYKTTARFNYEFMQ